MSQTTLTLKLGKLVRLIQEGNYSNAEYLISALSRDDINISKRTFERYIQKLREEFHINCLYSESSKGYFIEEDDSSHLNLLLRFTELLESASGLERVIQNRDKRQNIIEIDKNTDNEGTIWLQEIIKAIEHKQSLLIDYSSFDKSKSGKIRTISPWLLKFHKGRWYVLSHDKESQSERVFGLDRILDLQKSDSAYVKSMKNPKKLFNNAFGIWYKGKLENISIAVHPNIVPYFRSLALHPSQSEQSIPRKDGWIIYKYKAKNNQGLIIALQEWIDQIEIIEPLSLRDHFKKMGNLILKRHQ